jgi:hypothetical protein
MNYGYNKETKNWKNERKNLLAKKLSEQLKIPIGWSTENSGKPYIEIDGLYTGVRIRKITNLTEEEQIKLVTKADQIYEEVMR